MRDNIIVEKILNYCREIKLTHKNFNYDKSLFMNVEKGFIYRNSITMPILQIGELVKNFSKAFTSSHSGMPWKAIAGMRDIFAHHYGSIDYEMTWNTSIEDIAVLENYLKKI